jgi:nitrate/TMAO reductase-like tetraheme cytochrome c subunit
MKIEVTQKDIDKGLRSSCYECPIAHAFKRKVKNKIRYGFAVNADSIDLVTKDFKWYIHALPKKAQTFIKRFDDGKPVKPFTFEIEKDLK